MRKKVLFCATVDYHFKSFHLPILKWFKEMGWEVHIAANGVMSLPYVDEKFPIPIQRSPFDRKNLRAYRQLKQIINKNDYDIIHCHTPMGGVLTRLAAIESRKKGANILYTAHGFHFCKGAPIQNWLLYYPIEKILAKYTDCLITINQEDYQLAITHRFMAIEVEHVHGVGIDTDKFKPISKIEKRKQRKKHGYHENDFLLFYAAEFNKNKNHQLLIRVMAKIKDKVPNAKLLLAGEGYLLEKCKKLALELGVTHMVKFLGYREDVHYFLPICDIGVSASLREGLPVNIMEAMSCGLPVIATENRGHNELIQNNVNGRIVESNNLDIFANDILDLVNNSRLINTLGQNGRNRIVKFYSDQKILQELNELYKKYMGMNNNKLIKNL